MISRFEAAVSQRPCRDCVRELSHCHGSLIVHRDGALECTEADCVQVHFAVHELVLECAQLGDCCGVSGRTAAE